MLTFADVKDYVVEGLTALGYTESAVPNSAEPPKRMPAIHPGPFGIERLVRVYPGPVLFLVVGNGAGLETEGLYDQTFVTTRSIGVQRDFAYSEALAHDVDRLLLDCVNGKTMGDARVLYVTRTGGSPQLVELDAGERYHFQTTYIAEAKR